eukprot:scaffold504_cov189-Ochromonas_danica.AAC.17
MSEVDDHSVRRSERRGCYQPKHSLDVKQEYGIDRNGTLYIIMKFFLLWKYGRCCHLIKRNESRKGAVRIIECDSCHGRGEDDRTFPGRSISLSCYTSGRKDKLDQLGHVQDNALP